MRKKKDESPQDAHNLQEPTWSLYYLTHQPQVAPNVNPRSSKTKLELINQQPWTESNSQDHGLNQQFNT
jgi:hypothetical protein